MAAFSPDDLTRIREQTLIAGIDYFDSLPSTSDYALSQISGQQLDIPRLVLADHQTHGRGRDTNRWETSAGALTFTVVLDATYLGLPQRFWPLISLATAKGIRDALAKTAPEAEWQLKWPNDVFANQRKACGILLEVPPQRPPRVVIGIGVNVNNVFSAAHGDPLAETAVSLIDLVGRETSLPDVLFEILQCLSDAWSALREDPQQLFFHWRTHCLLTGRSVRWQGPKEPLVGVCRGIDDEGALLIEASGQQHRCVGGVIVSYEEPAI